MKNPGRIFLTGDIHGNPITTLSTKAFPEQKNLTKKDVVIILGDFGVLWSHLRTKEESRNLQWLDDRNFTTLFICGNHENFDLLNNLPEKELYGERVGIASHSVLHLRRGVNYRINNRNILTVGGAHSHDRAYRTWGKSMWKEEEITDQNIEDAKQAIIDSQYNIDYVLTHCAPAEWAKFAMPQDEARFWMPDGSEERLSKLKNTVLECPNFKRWYFGHYHNNIDDPFMDQWTCLYYKIVELKDD